MAQIQLGSDLRKSADDKKRALEEAYARYNPKVSDLKTYFANVFLEDGRYSPLIGEAPSTITAIMAFILGNKPVLIKSFAGTGKCLGTGTPVLKFDGSIVPVEDIKPGDTVMGPDSKPRTVLNTCSGVGPLYRITPVKGDSWVCNDAHILTLVGSNYHKGETIDINIVDALKVSKSSANGRPDRGWKLWRTGVDFPSQKVEFDPYMVGLWIGDGSLNRSEITVSSEDVEVIEYVHNFAPANGLLFKQIPDNKSKAVSLRLTSKTIGGRAGVPKKSNRLLTFLQTSCAISGIKNIPQEYIVNDRKTRMELLAGVLDSDGYMSGGGYDLLCKEESLAQQYIFLARSLGYAAYMKQTTKGCQNGFVGTYYRTSISGDLSELPLRLPRKKAPKRRQVKRVNVTGWDAKSIGSGEYHGFTLDGDGRFLLGDFTVTHNTVMMNAIWGLINDSQKYKVEMGSSVAIWNEANAINESSYVLMPELQNSAGNAEVEAICKKWGEGESATRQTTDVTLGRVGDDRTVETVLDCKPFLTTIAIENAGGKKLTNNEFNRRVIDLYTDVSETQTRSVQDYMLSVYASGVKEMAKMSDLQLEVLRMHFAKAIEVGHLVQEYRFPGAKAMSEQIPSKFVQARSALPQFIGIINSFALFNYKNRIITPEGVLLVTPEDLYLAAVCYGKRFAQKCYGMEILADELLQVFPNVKNQSAPSRMEQLNAAEVKSFLKKAKINIQTKQLNSLLESFADSGIIEVHTNPDMEDETLYWKSGIDEMDNNFKYPAIIEECKRVVRENYPQHAEDYIKRFCILPVVENPLEKFAVNLLTGDRTEC